MNSEAPTSSRYWDGFNYKSVTVEEDPDIRYVYTRGLPWFHVWRRATLQTSGATYFKHPPCHQMDVGTGRLRMLPISGDPICVACLMSLENVFPDDPRDDDLPF